VKAVMHHQEMQKAVMAVMAATAVMAVMAATAGKVENHKAATVVTLDVAET
jgi:hypothetical protein